MLESHLLRRRRFLQLMGVSGGAAAMSGCGEDIPAGRYTQADVDALARQREEEAASASKGPFGEQRFRGYRGLAELPWFELDDAGKLLLVDDSVPATIDVHAHLGISVLFKPELDLLARTDRVEHLLDCDGKDASSGCDLNLDVYINGNFTEEGLKQLRRDSLVQALWGSSKLRTHTIPNLLDEMDAMRVERSFVLPIKVGLPFGDDLTEQWRSAITRANAADRVLCGLSVNPHDHNCIEEMRVHAASGARMVKLHPTVQKFFPDDPKLMPLYEEARDLGLVIFFHGGRAGIEPEDRLPYAMPRHYESVLANFPELPVVLGHGGARDGAAMLAMASQYANAWLGTHGQSVTQLDAMIRATNGQRLLFGTDWPWYHLAATLAKVLICTDTSERRMVRDRILRTNAMQLFPELNTLPAVWPQNQRQYLMSYRPDSPETGAHQRYVEAHR